MPLPENARVVDLAPAPGAHPFFLVVGRNPSETAGGDLYMNPDGSWAGPIGNPFNVAPASRYRTRDDAEEALQRATIAAGLLVDPARVALRLCLNELIQSHSLHYPKCPGGCPAEEAINAARAALARPDPLAALAKLANFVVRGSAVKRNPYSYPAVQEALHTIGAARGMAPEAYLDALPDSDACPVCLAPKNGPKARPSFDCDHRHGEEGAR